MPQVLCRHSCTHPLLAPLTSAKLLAPLAAHTHVLFRCLRYWLHTPMCAFVCIRCLRHVHCDAANVSLHSASVPMLAPDVRVRTGPPPLVCVHVSLQCPWVHLAPPRWSLWSLSGPATTTMTPCTMMTAWAWVRAWWARACWAWAWAWALGVGAGGTITTMGGEVGGGVGAVTTTTTGNAVARCVGVGFCIMNCFAFPTHPNAA